MRKTCFLSARTEGNFRLYTDKDVERLLLIRRMKQLGYTLDEMRELLDVVDALALAPDSPLLRARLDEIRVGARVRREKLTEQLAMADEFVGLLSRLSSGTALPSCLTEFGSIGQEAKGFSKPGQVCRDVRARLRSCRRPPV